MKSKSPETETARPKPAGSKSARSKPAAPKPAAPKSAAPKSTAPAPAAPTPEEYRRFIDGIDLRMIQLIRMSCSLEEPFFNDRMSISFMTESSFVPEEGGFAVTHEYKLTGRTAGRKVALKISAVYLLHFTSHREMKMEFWEIYRNASLPLNTWPFFRELTHSITSRMNIPPLTLPLIKR